MTNAEVAVAVARAMEMPKHYAGWASGPDLDELLYKDGSNVFSDYWFKRCVLWLTERGSFYYLSKHGGWWGKYGEHIPDDGIEIKCPASEFPARVIAALVGRKEDNSVPPEWNSAGYCPHGFSLARHCPQCETR